MEQVWRRACVGCTKSKRQCTKGIPSCRRCLDRGIPCVYPPNRRTNNQAGTRAPASAAVQPSSTMGISANPPPASTIGGIGAGTSTAEAGDICDLGFDPLQLTHADLCAGLGGAVPQPPFGSGDRDDVDMDMDATDTWFMAPDSWAPDYTLPEMERELIEDTVMRRFVDGVQTWVRAWVTEGRSPLHHWHLYRESMPRSVQDAYTAAAAYYCAAETPATRASVARILDDRVTQLLQDQALGTAAASSLSASSSSSSSLLLLTSLSSTTTSCDGRATTSLFDHVARVQALLAYQAIRLFDGDVRMRAQAEALIPTLALWSRQLLEAARSWLSRPARFLAGFAASSIAGGDASADALWRAWVVVESARRSWLVANYMQEIYLHLKRGWGECPGRVAFTMRAGLWEAPSPHAWSRACRERGALFLPTAQTESLVLDSGPEDIDEFSVLVLELSYGAEKVQRWLGGGKGAELSSLVEVSG
ncbi:hypothetical protein GGR52DRAFT_586411 [Hypoxylon sp. FL1284]|nr:hypothetical protein GGR52DRAFT_586411 [Hypoxylon sp. FL1284]